MCFRASMTAVQTDSEGSRSWGSRGNCQVLNNAACQPLKSREGGEGKGAWCWEGAWDLLPQVHPLPQPMLGQASQQAKVWTLQLVGSGSTRAPLGTQQEWLGGLWRLEWCFAHVGRGQGSMSRAPPISEDEGQAPGSSPAPLKLTAGLVSAVASEPH